MDTRDIKETADQAGDSAPVEWGARLGFVVSGVLHLLIAWIAFKVAWSSSRGSASQSGALATLAHSPGGPLLLWVVFAGFALLAIWQLAQVVRTGSLQDRLQAAGQTVVFLALGWTAFKFAIGSPTSSDGRTKDFTASLIHHPGGRLAVAAIGLAVIVVGGYHVYKGWRKRFLEDLQEHPGNTLVQVARVGYVGKGVALFLVGILFLVAAVRNAPSKATGLDGGLRTLRDAPAGAWLLSAVAAGIAAYGVFALARTRYART
ncbi:MAG TPA: DUF1206 domain-containing protein [Flexivirga sp.]|uniref:DUF1206 domain-containing protein n=1 Tax=Flexivirga sp. TaxID=1962927 RepID=UPI002CEC164A|nr:DUF1206 domain-containing protein [Flexivirga sp.]HWC21893.1 DUF1206 domain-containing protein [Flexivirga sp.]